ncbi:MAG: hemerythrin domain-containing protein [Thermoplasmata archaeon]
MCNLHVELFREHVLGGETLKGVPSWHPLDVFIKENYQLLKDSEKLTLYVKYLDNINTDEEKNRKISEIKNFLGTLFDLKKHYFKQQMLLFPYIERRGITGVPRVLWTKEEEILDKLKDSMREVKLDPDIAKLKKSLMELSTSISDQIFRENNILYPTCWTLLSEGEWVAIQNQSELIGYYKTDLPENRWKSDARAINPYEVDGAIKDEQFSKLPMEIKNSMYSMSSGIDKYNPVKDGTFKLDKGYLSIDELESIIKTLPFELTFIDSEDRLRYFTNNNNT